MKNIIILSICVALVGCGEKKVYQDFGGYKGRIVCDTQGKYAVEDNSGFVWTGMGDSGFDSQNDAIEHFKHGYQYWLDNKDKVRARKAWKTCE